MTNRTSSSQPQKVTGLTLKEIAHRFNSPAPEEHAWAVCYLTVSKLSEMQLPSNCSMDTVVVTTDGNVELLQQKGM